MQILALKLKFLTILCWKKNYLLALFVSSLLFSNSLIAVENDEIFNPRVDGSDRFPPKKEAGDPFTVNLFLGGVRMGNGDTRGGLGDITANLWMLRLLKQNYPEIRFNVIVNSEYEKEVANLVPKYLPFTRSARLNQLMAGQIIDGVHFYLDAPYAVPNSDMELGYSMLNRNVEMWMGWSSGLVLTFDEFMPLNSSSLIRHTYRTEDPNPDHNYRMQQNYFFHDINTEVSIPLQTGRTYNLEAGAGNAGIYISPSIPPSPFGNKTALERRGELRSQIASAVQLSMGELPLINENTVLTVSYTSSKSTADLYLEALKLLASEPRFRNRQIVLVSNFVANDLPDNLSVVSFSKMPFNTFINLVSEADLPPMLRGDVSFSQGIEFSYQNGKPPKPPFYEADTWKVAAAESFANEIDMLMPNDSETFLRLGFTSYRELLLAMFRIRPSNLSLTPLQMKKIMMDTEFLFEIKTAIDQFRPKNSLVLNTANLMGVIRDRALQEEDYQLLNSKLESSIRNKCEMLFRLSH